jgi:ABC-2 type transport system permease protein
VSVLVTEARKVPAFMRRDLLVLLSYRVAFVSDLLFIAVQAAMFGFVAQLVDESKLPSYGGVQAGYFEFVMVGVVIATVSGLLLQKVSTAIRQEQMIGTLEALLVTPTSPTTVQAGSIAFDLVFIPVRMALLLVRCSSWSPRSRSGSRSSRAASCRASCCWRRSCRSCGASGSSPRRRS